MTSPLPPSDARTRVSTVMAGQIIEDPNGREFVVPHDGVLLELMEGGMPAAFLLQTPDAAIGLALTIQHHAVKATGNGVDDNGNKLPLAERIKRINAAYQKAGH